MKNELDLERFSVDELLELNRRITERIRFLRQVEDYKQIAEFRVGETVQFAERSGQVVTGSIIRRNKKTVSIVTAEGDKWNVSPCFVRKVVDGGNVSDEASNVLFFELPKGETS